MQVKQVEHQDQYTKKSNQQMMLPGVSHQFQQLVGQKKCSIMIQIA